MLNNAAYTNTQPITQFSKFLPRSWVISSMPLTFATGPHPRISAFTRRSKSTSVFVSSGGVSKVTVTHTSVVTPVVHSVAFAKITASEPWKGPGRPASAIHSEWLRMTSAVTSAAAMADISLHAFTRHQYHRSRYTPPVPAPSSSTIFQPSLTDCSCMETHAAAATRNSVASRDAFT